MMAAMIAADSPLPVQLHRDGFAFVPAARMGGMLLAGGPTSDWDAFVASWDDLGLDTHMADHGRYRRRRYAVFTGNGDAGLRREPHRAHFQTLDYNPLNGGIERWFEPILPLIAEGASLGRIMGFCHRLFDEVEGRACDWFIEAHQFRIEARAGEAALPTPEGMHRDGVDHVLVLLVRRSNILSGTTQIGTPEAGVLGSFTLTEPLDAAFVEDRRVYHAVTPVQPLDASQRAFRDVLVLTFRRHETMAGDDASPATGITPVTPA